MKKRPHRRRAHPRRTRKGTVQVNKHMVHKEFMFGDWDKDGVRNYKDCRPFDKTRQDEWEEDEQLKAEARERMKARAERLDLRKREDWDSQYAKRRERGDVVSTLAKSGYSEGAQRAILLDGPVLDWELKKRGVIE